MEGHHPGVRVLWFFIAFAVLTLITWGLWGGGFDSKFGFDGTVAWMQSLSPRCSGSRQSG